MLFLVVGRVGTAIGNYSIRFWIKGKQHLALSGQEVQESDSRPPVLYLRAFDTDKLTTHTVPSHKIAAYRTEEQQVARAFARFGPMLTLGRPGEPLPLVGAARSYVTHDEWQQAVMELIGQAGFVLIAAGESAALMWEIDQVVALVPPEKIVVLIPFGQQSYDAFRIRAAPHFGRMLPAWAQEARRSPTTIRAAVYFEPDWTAHFIRLDTEKKNSLEKSCYERLAPVYRRNGVSR
jgi:hypothetical protein